jgi:hypothetical protein
MAHKSDHPKPSKDFNRGIGNFHKSLGAIQTAAERSKSFPEAGRPPDLDFGSASVRIRSDG